MAQIECDGRPGPSGGSAVASNVRDAAAVTQQPRLGDDQRDAQLGGGHAGVVRLQPEPGVAARSGHASLEDVRAERDREAVPDWLRRVRARGVGVSYGA